MHKRPMVRYWQMVGQKILSILEVAGPETQDTAKEPARHVRGICNYEFSELA